MTEEGPERCNLTASEDGKRQAESKECRLSLEARKVKVTGPSLEPLERTKPAGTLILAQ